MCDMKPQLSIIAVFAFFWIICINSCRKEYDDGNTNPPELPSPPYSKSAIIRESFTEDFEQGTDYLMRGRWVFTNHSSPDLGNEWRHDSPACGKGGNCWPLIGYGYNSASYLYAGRIDSLRADNWAFSPPVALANGDKIIFYTMCGFDNHNDQLEVRYNEMDTTAAVGAGFGETGKFTKEFGKVSAPYPTIWTRFEFTVSGLSQPIQSRLAFRYYVPDLDSVGAGAIGIDALQFIKQ